MCSIEENIYDNNIQCSRNRNKKEQNKKKRMYGLKYEGFSKGSVSERKAREMKAGCSSKYCEKSSTRHCSLFSESVRKEIFLRFWQMSWDQKKNICYGQNCMFHQEADIRRRFSTNIFKILFFKHRNRPPASM